MSVVDVTAYWMGDPAVRFARAPTERERMEAARIPPRRNKDLMSVAEIVAALEPGCEFYNVPRNTAGRVRSAIANKGGKASTRLEIGGTYTVRRVR